MAMGVECAAMLPNKIPISLTMSRSILDFCDYRYRACSMGTNRHNPKTLRTSSSSLPSSFSLETFRTK